MLGGMLVNRLRYIYLLIGLATILVSGWRMNISIFYQYLIDYYKIDNITSITLFLVISSIVAMFSSSFLGVLYDRKGSATPLYIATLMQFFSAFVVWFMRYYTWDKSMWLWYIGGAMAGFVLPALVVTINPTIITIFSTKPNIALAIVQSGNYLAQSLWSPLIPKLIVYLDPFTTLSLLSITSAIMIAICGKVYSNIKIERSSSQNISQSQSIPRLFIVTLIPIFFIATSSIMLNSFIASIIIEFCRSFNIDENTILLTYIPMAIGVAGVLQCIGAFTWGFIARRIGVLKAFPLLYAFQTIATFMIISLSRIGIEAVIIAIWLRYLMFGGEPIIHMMVIPTLFGERNLGKLLGLQTSSVMASSIIAPLLGGIVRDLTGFFITTVATSAMFSLLATIIATIVVLFRHRIESL